MVTLGIDIETYSPAELTETGVYPYAEHAEFEILLFGYAVNDGQVRMIDLARGERLPREIAGALTDPEVLKTAYNAQFERVCLRCGLGIDVPPEQWECTMVKAAMLGLPFGLAQVSAALGLDEQKMAEGRALIRYFSMPCRPTGANGGRTRNLPEHAPEKWEIFKEYCARDVETERAVRKRIGGFETPEKEKRLYALDQRINDRGVHVDTAFARQAIRIDGAYREKTLAAAAALTGLENPNSVSQLKAWMEEQTGESVETLSRAKLPDMLAAAPSETVREMLRLRQALSKTSTKKYGAMLKAARDGDRRAGGLMQFYGANRTGRWAGRLVQVQNLPRNGIADLDLARQTVAEGDGEMLEMLYGDVPGTLSQLVRTAFTAPAGRLLTVADYSAIEARVVAWLAGEKWRLDVFASHGKIYEASAAQMFGVPVETVTKDSPLRQKGKVAELALGYQGGPNALVSMGALGMGLREEELQSLVDAWRAANPAIVRLWRTVNDAAMLAVGERTNAQINRNILIRYAAGSLYVDLPSGRSLVYVRPRIGQNRFGSRAILYEGMEQATRKWGVQETYGGKIVENMVQAIARDCLAEAMLRLDSAGYGIVMHVHDEVVIEHEEDVDCLEEVCAIMGEPMPWAQSLPLRAEGSTGRYYRK
jgi:DNA polymerase